LLPTYFAAAIASSAATQLRITNPAQNLALIGKFLRQTSRAALGE
jgi:hypothetical protein